MITIISALLAIAFYTLIERKFIGYIQHRKGPNKPIVIGVIVPFSDASKLLLKEKKNTIAINIKYHIIAPLIMIILSIILWFIYPHFNQSLFLKFRIIYFLCITRVGVYTTFIAGWGSNSKWRILGALRGIAQTISYEVGLSLILISFILYIIRINVIVIVQNQYIWIIFIFLPLRIAWIISILAETHRAPLDFTEGESELVSGFNIEYRRSIFALIFIAEYINILLIRLMTSVVLSSNWINLELIIKTVTLSVMFIWTRRALPRLRYDILIDSLWKKILPLSLTWFLTSILIIALYSDFLL